MTRLSDTLAQEKARLLAMCVAGLGLDALVLVHDASQALLATARYFADDPAGADALASMLMGLTAAV